MTILQNIFKIWKSDGQEDFTTPQTEVRLFALKYKSLLVGELKLTEGIWSFEYSAAFKKQDEIKPLADFPDVDKVYKSKELYPFFLHRIPSIKQPKVQRQIKEHKIDATNEADLLRFFGIHSISNPFSLNAV